MTEQIRRLYSGYPSMTVTLKTEHQAPCPPMTPGTPLNYEIWNSSILNPRSSNQKDKSIY